MSAPYIKITLTGDEKDPVEVDAPVENWPLCFHMLDLARTAITVHHARELATRKVVPAKASDLERVNGSKGG